MRRLSATTPALSTTKADTTCPRSTSAAPITAHSATSGMRQQRRLDLRPGDVVARRDDHVVVARGEMESPVFVPHKRITGEIPAVIDVVFLPLVGEIAATGRTAHRQPSDCTGGHVVHVGVDDLGFVTGDRPPGRAGQGVADRGS